MCTALFAMIAACGLAASDKKTVDCHFVKCEWRYIMYEKYEHIYVVTIDGNGEIDDVKKTRLNKQTVNDKVTVINWHGPAHEELSNIIGKDRKCYEYRMKMLIPGKFDESYRFVPDKDGKIVPFEDYEYSEKAIPIWNLPGRYEKIKK
jgi:hypothetical protein